jgi:hypothetical protein
MSVANILRRNRAEASRFAQHSQMRGRPLIWLQWIKVGDSTMVNKTMIAAAIAATAFGAPALAKTRAHKTYLNDVAQKSSTRRFQTPHFIGVGPNGYWVTTNWGCWIDEGQGRIHDCNYGGGP